VIPQAYFLDGNGTLLDSLFTEEQQIAGAEDTDGDGIADAKKLPPTDIELPHEKISLLEQTRYIVTRGKVITSNYPDEEVKFYSSYYLDYHVGLILQVKTNTGP
jgi:hypothetical protein